MLLNIVPANLSHSRNIWKWRNDPITRSVSKNIDEVAWDDHGSWFRRSLVNSDRYLYIGTAVTSDAGNSIGIVRFDMSSVSPEDCEISINIAPCARGKGFGRLLLEEGTAVFAKYINRSIRIIADVRVDNLASNRLFNLAGYSYLASTNINFNRFFLNLA